MGGGGSRLDDIHLQRIHSFYGIGFTPSTARRVIFGTLASALQLTISRVCLHASVERAIHRDLLVVRSEAVAVGVVVGEQATLLRRNGGGRVGGRNSSKKESWG